MKTRKTRVSQETKARMAQVLHDSTCRQLNADYDEDFNEVDDEHYAEDIGAVEEMLDVLCDGGYTVEKVKPITPNRVYTAENGKIKTRRVARRGVKGIVPSRARRGRHADQGAGQNPVC